jgi:hypothetical protein
MRTSLARISKIHEIPILQGRVIVVGPYSECPPGYLGRVPLASDGRRHYMDNARWVYRDFMFPEPKRQPSSILQSPSLFLIAPHVTLQFFRPESFPASGSHVMLRAAMPETPINKDRYVLPRKGDIRSPSGGRRMNAKSKAEPPEGASDGSLGGCIGPTYSGHLLGAGQRHREIPDLSSFRTGSF